MSARQELVTDGAEAIADLTAQYHQAVGAVVALVRTATGVDLTPSPGAPVMDATREQLVDAANRARWALRAMDIVLGATWGDASTFSECIRDDFWSDEDRERIAECLARAGLS